MTDRRCRIVGVACLFLSALWVAAVGAQAEIGPAAGSTVATSDSSSARNPSTASPSGPKTSFGQDTKFFTDVSEADPGLVGYEQRQGNVALRALLTDGSAFCALLQHSRGIDEALVAEAEGVRNTESQTHLPLSVTTFNTIESVALLTLCPAEQRLLPTADRSRIRQLGAAMAKRSR
jgi:hypothetical protein